MAESAGMAARCVVAADGGNSKTDLVLAGPDGSVLARVRGPGTHPVRDGVAGTARALADLTRAALHQAGLGRAAPLRAATFYLANVDLPEEEQAMHAALDRLAIAEQVEVGNDTVAVLQAGAARGWGVAVVSGAGINAIGRYPDGRTERFLGIGEFSGDWGGGWAVAVAGIGAAVRAGDRRGPDTLLRESVAGHFGADPERVAVAAQRGEIGTAQVLAFAPVVFGAASRGDAVATGIVHRLGDEVVDFAAALLRRMDLLDMGAGSEVDVVLGGGTLQSGHAGLLARIRDGVGRLAPSARVTVLDVAPVAGALAAALRTAGADATAMATARLALRY
jgi:N-acetylglucosamine kinase-like BadF-type ATPase